MPGATAIIFTVTYNLADTFTGNKKVLLKDFFIKKRFWSLNA
jgi:hypothetical protein